MKLRLGKSGLLVLLGMMCCLNTFATHIVGGELNYQYLGNNQYKVVLNLYKDCGTSIVPFDNPASIYVYDGNNQIIDTLFAPIVARDTLSAAFDDSCLVVPEGVCVDFAQYEIIVSLPASTLGYTLAYIRCCRNSTILNAVGIDEFGNEVPPDLIGATYAAKIPGTAVVASNSNPEFKEFPPIIICSGGVIDVDQSATDADGDQLVYSLCTPLLGGSLQRVFGDPTEERPPFREITWVEPYGLENILGGAVPLQINAVTGQLTGVAPEMVGQFVVGVCVEEFRNGVLLSTKKRDFQFNLVECVNLFVADFDIEGEANVELVEEEESGTVIQFLRICDDDLQVQFTSLATGSDSIYWDFGDGSALSAEANPLHIFPDTGRYSVMLIAQPENICADTFVLILDLQYQQVAARFAYDEPQCYHPDLGLQFYDWSLDSIGIANWQWNFGNGSEATQQNPTAFYPIPGFYEVNLAVQSQNGCRDDIGAIIQIIPIDPYLLEDMVALCEQDSIQIDLQINNIHDFVWSPAESLSDATIQSPLAFPTENTTYQVQIFTIRPSGVVCLQQDSIHVLTDWPVPTWINTTELVQCDSMIQLSIETDAENEVAWSENANFNPIFSSNSQTSFIQTEEQEIYFVRINNQFCEATESIEILQHAIYLAIEDVTNCIGDSSILTAGIHSNVEEYTIDWTVNGDVETTDTPQLTVFTTETVDLFLLAQNESGCSAQDTITIFINPLPEIEADANPAVVINQQEVQLLVTEESDFSYSWTADILPEFQSDLYNPVVLVDKSVVFVVEVTNENGCINRDTIIIDVVEITCDEPNIFVPNAFSPNHDNLNDVFRIQGEVINSLELQIFDRWGNLVFKTNDLDEVWTGLEHSAGVFGYQLTVNCFGGARFIKAGNITLLK
jgi:gliding motility-associated-like protein